MQCSIDLNSINRKQNKKNGWGDFIIPCTFDVNMCTGLLFSYSSYHCVVMKSVVPDNFGGRDTNREKLKLLK